MAYLVGRISRFSVAARTHRSILVSWVAMQIVVLGSGWWVFQMALSLYRNTGNGWWIGLAAVLAALAIAMSILSIGMLRSQLFPKPLHRRG